MQLRRESVEFVFDEICKLTEGGDLLIFHLQLHTQLALQVHDHLHDVQRINAQGIEGAVRRNVGSIQLQLPCRIGN